MLFHTPPAPFPVVTCASGGMAPLPPLSAAAATVLIVGTVVVFQVNSVIPVVAVSVSMAVVRVFRDALALTHTPCAAVQLHTVGPDDSQAPRCGGGPCRVLVAATAP